MYDLLGPVLINGFFFSINLMSVHNSAKFQHCGVIFVKSAVDIKNRIFFRYRALFFADTVFSRSTESCSSLGFSSKEVMDQVFHSLKYRYYTK
jgi:hypothetical protein